MRLTLLLSLIAVPALADAPERQVVGKVVEAHAALAAPGKVVTQLVVAVSACDGKPCSERLRLVVAGGKVGNFEQRVADLRVPAPGEEVFLSLGPDHLHILSAPESKRTACR